MTRSGKLSDIQPSDPSTWQEKLFLTIDIDWAHDDVLADAIELVDRSGVCATWFVTHDTPMLARLRVNANYELGIHPNFNWLLAGDSRNGANAAEVIDRLMRLVPEARSVRSHSMTQSTGLLHAFADAGLTHDANHFVPASSEVALRPWLLWNGMIRVPYCWEDDVFCVYRERGIAEPDIHQTIGRPGLRVFDFHPIHLFLNTESIARYERTRNLHQTPGELSGHRFDKAGARVWLGQLLDAMQDDCGTYGGARLRELS